MGISLFTKQQNRGLFHFKAFAEDKLTLSQTTNFRLFPIESFYRQPFEKGRKHCGKRRNCSL